MCVFGYFVVSFLSAELVAVGVAFAPAQKYKGNKRNERNHQTDKHEKGFNPVEPNIVAAPYRQRHLRNDEHGRYRR